MRLCDRCIVPGCCLDYLSPACNSARKKECPEVQPTNAEAIAGMELNELAEFLSGWATCLWTNCEIRPAEVREWLETPRLGGARL